MNNELSILGLIQGVNDQLQRAFFLDTLTDPELEEAIGRKIAEKLEKVSSLE